MEKFGDKLDIDRHALVLLVALPTLAGLVLGANQTRAGAFMPWLGSIGYWLAISFSTWWLIGTATWLLGALLRPWQPPRWVVWLAGAIAGSFAARPAIYAITDLFRPLMHDPVLRRMRPFSFDPGFLIYYLTNWSLIITMWIVACALVARWRAAQAGRAGHFQADEIDRHHPGRPAEMPGFLRRLPPAIGHDIVALKAEDHYIRVYTSLGNALVLGSLSEAIEDLARSAIAGQRTHRSWWVANHAVRAHNQRGRYSLLELCNGVEVPLSLTYRQTALASGLLLTPQMPT